MSKAKLPLKKLLCKQVAIMFTKDEYKLLKEMMESLEERYVSQMARKIVVQALRKFAQESQSE